MEFEEHDSSGAPTGKILSAPGLVIVPSEYKLAERPWIALGRDGGAVVMFWVPSSAGDNALQDPTVPLTFRPTTFNLKQLMNAGLKRGTMPRDTLLARLLNRVTESIQRGWGI